MIVDYVCTSVDMGIWFNNVSKTLHLSSEVPPSDKKTKVAPLVLFYLSLVRRSSSSGRGFDSSSDCLFLPFFCFFVFFCYFQYIKKKTVSCSKCQLTCTRVLVSLVRILT